MRNLRGAALMAMMMVRKDLDEGRSHGTSRCSHAKAKSLGDDALPSATALL